MKRVCPCCNKKFVFNKKIRKEEIREGWLPYDTDGYCYPCIKDIASIEADERAAFWEQSLPLSFDCVG